MVQIGLDVQNRRVVDQVDARQVNGVLFDSVDFRDCQADVVPAVGRASRKDAHLLAAQLWREDERIEPQVRVAMEHKGEHAVRIAVESSQRIRRLQAPTETP